MSLKFTVPRLRGSLGLKKHSSEEEMFVNKARVETCNSQDKIYNKSLVAKYDSKYICGYTLHDNC